MASSSPSRPASRCRRDWGDDPDDVAGQMAARYAHGTTEIGLFRRSAAALPDVLQGRMDPLTLLFSSGEPTAADLYLKAPVARAANRLLADAVAALLAGMPDGRRLRVIEVGAGTGSATAALLPELPDGRYDYVYTDISAGFFSEAESRFGGAEASIDLPGTGCRERLDRAGLRSARLRLGHRIQRAARDALPQRNAGALSRTPRALGSAGGAGEPARPGLGWT